MLTAWEEERKGKGKGGMYIPTSLPAIIFMDETLEWCSC